MSLFSVMTKDIHDCNRSPETMLVSSRHCFYIQSCFVIGSIKYISIMYMCFPCREQSRTIGDFSDMNVIVTISGLTHENLSRSRCDFSFKAGFTLVRSDIACDSTAAQIQTVWLAEIASAPKWCRTLFVGSHGCSHLCNPIPVAFDSLHCDL